LQRAFHPRERAPHQSLSFHLLSSQITQIAASCFLQPGSGARGGQALLPAARRWSQQRHRSPLPAATGGRLPRRQHHAAEEWAGGGAERAARAGRGASCGTLAMRPPARSFSVGRALELHWGEVRPLLPRRRGGQPLPTATDVAHAFSTCSLVFHVILH
jgi:hypothetical protein